MITLLTLVSCGGGDDDLAAPQTGAASGELVPITFNGNEGLVAEVTRAGGTPLHDANVDQFHVWGYKNMADGTQKVFQGYQVEWGANTAYTTTSNTNNWEYVGISDQTIKFWDWSAQAYRFFAVTGWTSHEPNEPNGPHEFTVAADVNNMAASPYFSRLWYSTGNPTYYPDKQFGKPVTLEFVQPYARVRFIFIYVYPREGINLTEKSFKPSDGSKIYRKGAVKVTYHLTGATTIEEYSMTPAAEVAVEDPNYPIHLTAFSEDYDPENDGKEYAETNKGWYTVVPNTLQGSYTLSVKVNGAVKTAVVPAEYMQWKPGYGYTYIFKITDEGGIKIGWVDYAVTPWDEMEADWTVYNW